MNKNAVAFKKMRKRINGESANGAEASMKKAYNYIVFLI